MRLLLHSLAALGIASATAPATSAQVTIDREIVSLNPSNPTERFANVVVRNTGAVSLQGTVQLEDWDVDAQGTSHWRKSGAVAGSCGRRVTVSPATLTIAPGEQHVVRIAVNADAHFAAECWSAAVVQLTSATASPNSSDSIATTRSTVPLYVTPNGMVVDGELTDMYVKSDSLEVVFKNVGKQRVYIVGEVHIQKTDDARVATIPLAEATVLVGATRRLRIAMPMLPRGHYTVIALVDFGGDELTAVRADLEMK